MKKNYLLGLTYLFCNHRNSVIIELHNTFINLVKSIKTPVINSLLISFLIILFSTQISQAQLLTWNTFGNAGTETTEPSTSNNSNISAANLTQGTITAAGNGNRFGGTGWFNTGNTVAGNTLSEAVAGNDYIQFVVTPNSGFSFTATSFTFIWDRSGTGPLNVALRSSVDGFTSDLGTVTGMVSGGVATTTTRTITITGLTSLTSATTFRLYGYGATATGGSGGFDCASSINNVALNGTTAAVSVSPTITTTGTLSSVNTTYGTASGTPTTFTTSGSNLTNDILITPPAGYEVSQTSGGASGYAATQTLTQASGSVASTTIYVRLKADATVAGSPYSGNIALSSTGATAVNVATVSSTVSPKALTITGLSADNKVYDATTTASLSGTPAYSGLENSETFSVTGTATASFATASIGNAKTVSVTGYTAPSTNYSVTQPTLTANITPAILTVTGVAASNKVYNGNNLATVTGTLSGVIGSEIVTLNPSGTFSQTGIGTALTVTSTSIIGGVDAGNYSLTQPTGLTADITAKPLTITGLIANNKVFDGNTTATLSGTAVLNGVVSGEEANVTLTGTPTATFAQSAVGTGIVVTVIGYSLIGSGSGNYTVSQPSGLTADITNSPSPVINSALTASATYGVASTSYFITASNSPTSYNATGLPTGLTINTTTGEISGTPTDVAGSPFSVTISATNGGGTGTANLVYTITPKALTLTSPSVPNKVYDRTNAATITGTLTGVVGTDIVTLNGTGTFSQVTVGSGLAVTSTSTLGGADASKYFLTQPTGLTADITTLALTVTTPVAQNKVFDGNTNATITGTLSGVISPDVINLLGTGTFASSAVGTGIAVTSTSTLGGADAGNYTLTQPTGLTANITASQFTEGNITVFVAAASANNTTANIVELNPNNPNQLGSIFPIPTSGANLLRFSGSASSTGYLANSNDGSLLLFNGANNTNTTSNANTLNPRGVGTFNSMGIFNLPTTYTGSSGNQTRSSTSIDNVNIFIADQGGIYTNGSTSASPSGNFRSIKSFGGVVYVSQSSSMASVIQVNTVSALTGGTITGLSGLTSNSILQDFYLISSGTNGASFDILYTLSGSSATVGTIAKYSLVSGSWVANGTHTTAFGGFGLASKKAGTGSELFISTGTGATTTNSVIKLIDVAGYNTSINITTANNLVLYTAPTGTIAKGVAFSPVSAPASVNLSVSTNSGTEAGMTVITVNAVSTTQVTGAKTVSLAVMGTDITAGDYTLSNTTITIPDGATTGSVTFTVVDDNLAEATETAILTISNPSSGIILGAAITQNITITDNDNTAPLIVIDVATTSNYVDGGITVSPESSVAISGVINDTTDPAKNFGIDFTIADAETTIGSLTVTATSSNLTVLPVANLNLTGTGTARNLKITPNAEGFSTITVSVNDGVTTTSYLINYASSTASINPTTTRFHTGTADASTAQMIDNNLMIVADDENQALRMYNRQNSGLPITSFDFTSSLGLTDISGGNPREVDVEASAKVGNRIYWMGSHSNASSGNNRPNRSRFFATDISGTGNSITLSYVGRYDNLKTELLAWDANNGHGLGANFLGLTASTTPGKAPEIADGSGFNIEGFEIAPNNTTAYICFRAPLQTTTTRTKALIIPLTNFADLVSGNPNLTTATFGTPIQLDLGGRAIREMKRNASGEYLIMAGPHDGSTGIAPKDFRFYTWTGNPADAPILRSADLTTLNSGGSFESIVDLPSPLLANSNLQVLVDNGDAVFYGNGVIAKELPQNNHKKFRSELVNLGTEILPLITIKSIKTGNWEDVSTWDLGRIPQAGDLVIIDQNHEVTLNGNGNAKKIEYQGTGKLMFSSTASTLNTGL